MLLKLQIAKKEIRYYLITRKHSSRMLTPRFSSHHYMSGWGRGCGVGMFRRGEYVRGGVGIPEGEYIQGPDIPGVSMLGGVDMRPGDEYPPNSLWTWDLGYPPTTPPL